MKKLLHDDLPSSESDDGSYDSDDMERGSNEEEYVGPEIDYDKAEEHWHLNLEVKSLAMFDPAYLGALWLSVAITLVLVSVWLSFILDI